MRWNLRRTGFRRAVAASIGCLFLALTAYQVWGQNGYFALRRKWAEEREWQARIHELQRQNEELANRIHELGTNPRVIEKMAREELMLVRPEDRIIVTPDKK